MVCNQEVRKVFSVLTRGLQVQGLHSYLRIKVLNKWIVFLCTSYLVLVYCNPYRQSAQQLSQGREKNPRLMTTKLLLGKYCTIKQ